MSSGSERDAASPKCVIEAFAAARLHASMLAQDDLDDMIRLHSDPEVSQFLGGVWLPAVTARYVDTNIRHWVDHGFGLWTFRAEDGAFRGRAGLRFLDLDGVREVELAYAFERSAWGRGFATEVATVLVGMWRQHCAAETLVAVVARENRASQRVLSKVGFRHERDTLFRDTDVAIFRLHRESVS